MIHSFDDGPIFASDIHPDFIGHRVFPKLTAFLKVPYPIRPPVAGEILPDGTVRFASKITYKAFDLKTMIGVTEFADQYYRSKEIMIIDEVQDIKTVDLAMVSWTNGIIDDVCRKALDR